MPLLDHFHAPLWPRRDWHSFLTGWSTLIAADFNRTLPDDCFAEGGAQFNVDTLLEAIYTRTCQELRISKNGKYTARGQD